VQVEVDLGPARLDIRYSTGLRTYYIDVSVVHPAAAAYVLAAADTDDAAASQRAQEKRLRYNDALASRGVDPASLVPFVLETSGRLGPDARAFIETVKDSFATNTPNRDATTTVNFFCDRMRHALLEGNGLLVHQAWSRLIPLQPPVANSSNAVVSGGPE
jgi:hypothetical protein